MDGWMYAHSSSNSMCAMCSYRQSILPRLGRSRPKCFGREIWTKPSPVARPRWIGVLPVVRREHRDGGNPRANTTCTPVHFVRRSIGHARLAVCGGWTLLCRFFLGWSGDKTLHAVRLFGLHHWLSSRTSRPPEVSSAPLGHYRPTFVNHVDERLQTRPARQQRVRPEL
ncbi:hypothetical protein LX32DRAFT_200115 [Colletotrichum zoysiae]|uniref:Uncharacterized protein n=1 Tax=Colletotrichum zoysiae TaxID=1216348 RepID=A0AAD9M447_9PEZI|nr:hypothetical protein LX32DRAFT_200115 [Colletotrichum zoysiae]